MRYKLGDRRLDGIEPIDWFLNYEDDDEPEEDEEDEEDEEEEDDGEEKDEH